MKVEVGTTVGGEESFLNFGKEEEKFISEGRRAETRNMYLEAKKKKKFRPSKGYGVN